jgi:hypothetical protein
MIKAALNPKQFKSLNELMDVLQATGRAMKGQSITATRQQGIKQLESEAAGPILSKVSDVAGGPSAWREWFRHGARSVGGG